MILLSIRTFWYKGSAENKEKCQIRKKVLSLKEQPRLEGHFLGTVAIWYLEVNMECVAYNIQYLTYTKNYSTYNIRYPK